MHYKTLLLELIRQNPELHNSLKQAGTLAVTLDRSARELKANHEVWQAELSTSRPQTDPAQIRSEALELALKEMESRFGSESAADEANPLSLDDAMMFLRRASPTA